MSSTEILLGPIKSGKSDRAVREYISAVKQGGPDSAIMILPTRSKAAHTRKTILLEHDILGLLSAQVMTFNDIVERVLDNAPSHLTRISDVGRYLILERILRGKNEAGELEFFKNVADFAGMVDVIGRLIGELKLSEVEPRRFLETLERRGASPRDREIEAIYSEYQQVLHERRLYDTEGGYWLATLSLRERGGAVFEKVKLVVIDGFRTFTSAELTFVKELSEFIPRLLFTLHYEDGAGRADLFATTARTLELLRERFPEIAEVSVPRDLSDSPLATFRRELFRNVTARDRPAISADGAIEIIEAPTESREVEEIARECKRLIRECGYKPDDIAVVFRALDPYISIVHDTFRDYGLPYVAPRGEPLSRSPVVKTIVNALAVPETDWDRDTVVGLLKSNYVLLDGDPNALLPEKAELWARSAAILRGKEQWLARLERKRRALEARRQLPDEEDVASENERRRREDERRERVAEVSDVIAYVKQLGDLLDNVPSEGTPGDYVKAVCELIERVGIRDAILNTTNYDVMRNDLTAYGHFLELLSQVVEYADDRTEQSLSQFVAALRHTLDRPFDLKSRGTEGKISVLDAHTARHFTFPVVFIGGMVEKMFPQQHGQDPLYNDSARRQLARHGVRLPESAAKQSEEMFLFYSAIACATERLYFTYPTSDANGQSRMRSFYLGEVLKALDPEVTPRKLLYSEPVPGLDAVWNTADLGQWLFNTLWDKRAPREKRDIARALYNSARKKLPNPTRTSILSAFLEERRQSADPWDEYDGVLERTRASREIAICFSPEYRFSATALDEYGCCPFMFFCKRVLGLEPIEEPVEELTPRDRGTLYHTILWRFYTGLRDERAGKTTFSEEERDEALARIRGAARTEFKRLEANGLVGNESFWQLAKRAIERNLERFVDYEIQLSQSHPDRRPAYFELCFGMRYLPPQDEHSTTEPLLIEDVRLGGKIDRVDIDDKDNTGTVVDYKTGNAKASWTEVAAGRSFQLPVYWWACEGLLGTRCAEACFYRLCGDFHRALNGLQRNRKGWEDALRQCKEYIKQYAESLRRAEFPVMPSDKCPRWCGYKEMCRYERPRIERKKEHNGTD